jgi:uncharacterized membrane protein
VIITIMVLELKPPHGFVFESLRESYPTFLTYALSFVFVGIYWNNHHHLIRAIKGIDGRVMWFNLHLLFWLSLVPFTTSWLGEYPRATAPTAVYGIVLLGCAIAFTLLQFALMACNGGENSALAQVVNRDVKGKASAGLYVLAIAAAFINPWISDACYIIVALIWFYPDPRMEQAILSRHE